MYGISGVTDNGSDGLSVKPQLRAITEDRGSQKLILFLSFSGHRDGAVPGRQACYAMAHSRSAGRITLYRGFSCLLTSDLKEVHTLAHEPSPG